MKKILMMFFLMIFIISCTEKISEEITKPEIEEVGKENELKVEEVIEPEPEVPKTVDVPASKENNCIGFLTGGGGSMEMELISSTGGAWSRPHAGPFSWGLVEPKKGNFDFSDTDSVVKMAQNRNIVTLATIWPFADWDQESHPECKVNKEDQFYPESPMMKDGPDFSIPKYRCAPFDTVAYQTFLTKLIERYDGDGIDDMPGLTVPVKYWEILNEPEMNSPDLTFYKGTKEEYVGLLKSSYGAIKEACPDCKVVQAGAAGSDDTLDYWSDIFDLGAADYFDIANIHFIGMWDIDTLNVKDYKALMENKGVKKPLWVTEAQLPSDSQAKVSFEGAINAGASKVFFVSYEFGTFSPPTPGKHSKIFKELLNKCP